MRVPSTALMAGIQAGIFNYDRPIIRKLAADRCVEAALKGEGGSDVGEPSP